MFLKIKIWSKCKFLFFFFLTTSFFFPASAVQPSMFFLQMKCAKCFNYLLAKCCFSLTYGSLYDMAKKEKKKERHWMCTWLTRKKNKHGIKTLLPLFKQVNADALPWCRVDYTCKMTERFLIKQHRSYHAWMWKDVAQLTRGLWRPLCADS